MSTRYLRVVLLGGLMALVMLISAVGSAVATDPGKIGDEGNASPRNANYILSIVSANATQKVDPSTSAKSATYGFQVKNIGDTSLPNTDLQLYPWSFPPDKWSFNFIPSCPFEVNPGVTKTVLLVIYPDQYAEAKRYTFQLKGKTGTQTNSISINLDVAQYGDVMVKAPPTQGGNPGDNLEFIFEIVNKGNGKDKFNVMSIETGVPSMAPYLKDQNNWTTEIATGKSAFKVVVVTIPYDQRTTEGSAGLQMSVTVMSNFNKTQEDVNWTLIQVYHAYDISIGVSPPNATLLPGQQAEFTITVLNLGNGWDNITLTPTYSFDASSWTINLGRDWFNLSAGRNNVTKLKITPPLNALKGSNYRIDLLARSCGPPYPEMPVERLESITLAILQVREVYVPVQNFTAPSALGPGEVVRFGFNLTNRGNGEDMVNITTIEKPVGWLVSLDFFANIRMQPYATQPISMTVQASVNRNESLYQKYTVKLQVVNSAKTSIIMMMFDISVKPVYEWEFTVEEPIQGQVNPYARNIYSFTLYFTNTGNVKDDVQLSLSGDYASWGTLDTTAVTLSYGERKVVRLQVNVPQSAEISKEYPLKITAVSQNKADIIKEATVTVTVVHLDLEVIPLGSLEVNGQVWKDYKTALHNRLNFTVTVSNAGTESLRGINVKFYDNDVLFFERNTTSIAPLKTQRILVQWEAESLGVHVIKVRLDANNQVGEVHEDNNEGKVNVKVETQSAVSTGDQATMEWLYPLMFILLLCVAGGVAYVIISRRPKVDKELYESIYGKKEEKAAVGSLSQERAEIERRAMEKGEEVATTPGSYDPVSAPQTAQQYDYTPPPEASQPAYDSSEKIDISGYQSASQVEQQAYQQQGYDTGGEQPREPSYQESYQQAPQEPAYEPAPESTVPPTYELPQPKEESYETPVAPEPPARPEPVIAPTPRSAVVEKAPVVLGPPKKKAPIVIKPARGDK